MKRSVDLAYKYYWYLLLIKVFILDEKKRFDIERFIFEIIEKMLSTRRMLT
jgi:hypothetical protein